MSPSDRPLQSPGRPTPWTVRRWTDQPPPRRAWPRRSP